MFNSSFQPTLTALDARRLLLAACRLGARCIGLLVIGLTPLAALDPARRADSYSIQGWTTSQGLPSNKIRGVTQTRDGYLWLATAQGIARFDGSSFTAFAGPTNPDQRGGSFFSVQEALDGSLWFGGDNGIFRWRHGSFEQFTMAHGLANNYVRGLTLTRDGALVACTRSGISFVRDGRVTTPRGLWKESDGIVRSFLELPDGSRLIGTLKGLQRVSGTRIEQISGTAGFPGSAFYSLTETPDGSVWIGYSGGLRRILPDGTKEDFGVAQGLIDPRVQSVLRDHNDNLWIVTYGNGFYRLTNGRIEPVTFPDLPGGLAIQQVCEDREGALWLAASTGLYRVTDNMSRTINQAEGLAQTSVYSVLEASDGAWWIGLWGGGVYRYDQTAAVRVAVPAALGLDQVLALAEEPAGTFWIGASTGLYRHRDGVTTNLFQPQRANAWLQQLAAKRDTILPGLAHQHPNSIVADGAGGLWVGTDGALYHGREGSFRALTTADGLPGNLIKSVIRTRSGDVWITAPPEGVACLHEGRWTNYLCGQAISEVVPRAAYEDSTGTIWITTEGGGLNRFQDGRWRNFTTRDGLEDDFISGISEDKLGNFWIAFPRGVMRVPRTEFAELDAGTRATLRLRVFDRSDGLPAAETNQKGSPNTWLTRDGHLLLATDGGVAVLEPGNLRSNPLVPPMHLERIDVNGAEADLSHPISVPPGGNYVQIHYTALSLRAPEKVRFKIRLAPLDRDWVDNGTRREVRYDKLPPGAYTFRAIACNNDGIWNDEGVTLAFRVRPFFYQTGWFTGLMVLVVGGAIFGGYRAQVRRARRQMLILETLVEKRTHELRGAKDAAEAAVMAKNEVIDALGRAEREREQLHRQLLDASRRAGMAEVATGVLHNVGNVLNSVNVSATLLSDQLRRSKGAKLGKIAEMLNQHEADLGAFITSDPKGRVIPTYLTGLADQLAIEQAATVSEVDSLRRNVEHIKEIVAMQQSYAKASGVTETIAVVDLVEDALGMNIGSMTRHGIEIVREYRDRPVATLEKHKVLQILVNLIANAKHACDDSGRTDKKITVRITADDHSAFVAVSDNGVGIPAENLTRIFAHGFTTREHGHGFGLHNGALAARELGGSLTAYSDGPGLGACFVLELPFKTKSVSEPEV